MGKTSEEKKRERDKRALAVTQPLPDPAWERAVSEPVGVSDKRDRLARLLFERFPGIPLNTTDQARVNAHRVYFAWDGASITMMKKTDLPRPTDAEVAGALLALAEDASRVA